MAGCRIPIVNTIKSLNLQLIFRIILGVVFIYASYHKILDPLSFSDNIDVAAEYKVQYILQPGGSIRDQAVKDACEKYNIKMICSDQRVFTH